MGDNEEIPKECNRIVTEFDAVHPRFAPEDPNAVLKYEKENYYYCKQCRLYFAPTFIALKTHFKHQMIEHNPIGTCFYCKGKVYEFLQNEESKLYHNCRDQL